MFTLLLLYLGAHTGIVVAPPAVVNSLAAVSTLEQLGTYSQGVKTKAKVETTELE